MKQIPYREFWYRIQEENMYFVNSFEDAVIRNEVSGDRISYYVKFRGKNEFVAEKESNVVTGGFEEHIIISKEEYEAF